MSGTSGWAVVAIVVVNMVSVIGVVSLNKLVYKDGFRFPTTLMVFHFLCTWGFVSIAERLRWFTQKRIDWQRYAALGAAQVGSVALVNLSLLFNTVGTYQLFKFTNVIMTVVIEFLWLRKLYTPAIYASLAIVVTGVSLATVTQVSFSGLGLLFGILGSLASAIYQIYNKRIQTEYEVSALQLLQFEQPWTALWAAFFACFSDDLPALANVNLTQQLAFEIFLSCVCAFGVNLSCYLIIGKTSPLTYSVVGHVKTLGVLLMGFLAFQEETTLKNTLGLATAFAGIVWYTHLSTNQGRKKDDGDRAGASANNNAEGGNNCAEVPLKVVATGGSGGAGEEESGAHPRRNGGGNA